RPGNQVVGQYYNFLRLGRDGYTRILANLRDTARYLAGRVVAMGPFELLSDGDAIPVFAFRLKDAARYSVYDVSERLRVRGWQVPAYTMPPDAEGISVLRIVIREGFSRDMAELLIGDLEQAVESLEHSPPRTPAGPSQHFHH
ncbi:MAG TPA: glutamate decarboxylase, partial [Gammaproteobacteria bacterium]|nr:glutamate decarboxylase [Gammaproteobacteria bacterium]